LLLAPTALIALKRSALYPQLFATPAIVIDMLNVWADADADDVQR
jgi:hypothetical protein